MPCYDGRDEIYKRQAEIAAAVRGFLLCRLMSANTDASIVQISDAWFKAHQNVDTAATLYKTTRNWQQLERARENLAAFERLVHERLVKSGLLEKI
jgi:hypothetical protein